MRMSDGCREAISDLEEHLVNSLVAHVPLGEEPPRLVHRYEEKGSAVIPAQVVPGAETFRNSVAEENVPFLVAFPDDAQLLSLEVNVRTLQIRDLSSSQSAADSDGNDGSIADADRIVVAVFKNVQNFAVSGYPSLTFALAAYRPNVGDCQIAAFGQKTGQISFLAQSLQDSQREVLGVWSFGAEAG